MKEHPLGMKGTGSASSSAAVQSTLLGELLEHACIGVVAVDEGHYVAANAQACALLGFRRDELIGRRVGDRNAFAQAPADGRLELARKDGSPLDVRYRVTQSSVAGLTVSVALFWPA